MELDEHSPPLDSKNISDSLQLLDPSLKLSTAMQIALEILNGQTSITIIDFMKVLGYPAHSSIYIHIIEQYVLI